MLIIKSMETDFEKEGKAFVHWVSWQATYGKLLDRDFMATYTLGKCRHWAYAYPDNTLVAKLADKVLGFVCYGKSSDQASTGEIFAPYLLPEYQGQGIGYDLL